MISKQIRKSDDPKKDLGNKLFEQKLLSYCRFTTSFTKERFKQLEKYGLPSDVDPKKVKAMDCVDQIKQLCEIGQAVAKEQFDIELFDGFVD